ncbi:SulP family inorganic anion transporter [bacterium]|nr:SulP family inorganic anion transporter [bacterium]MBU1958891.1 SulP family inorganic anion transporter [bacterium]
MEKRVNLVNNLFGGLTAAVIALPLGLAFGVASGLGAAAGIYGAIILGFFASLFGGTPTQISGPTGPMTVVIAAAVISLNHDITLITTTIFLAGILQILFALFKVGKFVQYIPYPVISGFMSGVGVIIIILQINPYLGLQSDASVVNILFSLPSNITDTSLEAFLLATATLSIMFFTPQKIAKIIPTPLIALTLLTPLSIYLNFHVQTIGEIPTTLPSITLPTFNLKHYKTIITLAVTLAILGTIDTLLTSIVADSITNTKHKPNQELIGQGIGNSLCSIFGAVPGAGATMRTVINVKSGGTNKISGMFHALVLLVIVIFLAPLASQIPLAILAGILIKVGIDILDYRFLAIWRDSPKHDLAVMLSVFFITIFVDLITAVGVGIVLSSLLIVYRITKETQITLSNDNEETIKQTYNLDSLEEKKIRVLKINGAFFFGSSTAFESKVTSVLDIETMIIDLSNVPFIDITAIFTLKDLILKLQKDDIKVIIVSGEQHKNELLKFNKMNAFDNVKFYNDIDKAIEGI